MRPDLAFRNDHMKFRINLLSLAVLLAFVPPKSWSATSLKIMTYNLRYASTNKPNAWPDRRPIMKECIQQAGPDLFGTQEGLYHQLKDLEQDLPDYRWIGTGRDGGSRGEFMAIFYKPARFEPMEFDHFWLSDTPEVIGSTTWGNKNRRMVTWVRFKDRSSGEQFYHVNTHFDHEIQAAREKSSELLLSRLKKLNQQYPIIVTGDFNAKAGVNKAYHLLLAEDWLTDTWNQAKEKRGEIVATFNNFQRLVPGDNRIDWILGRGIETDWIQIFVCEKNGQYPSDHFPVIAEVRLK